MSDNTATTTLPVYAYPQARLRITGTYAPDRVDGPQTVDIEVNDPDTVLDGRFIGELVDALTRSGSPTRPGLSGLSWTATAPVTWTTNDVDRLREQAAYRSCQDAFLQNEAEQTLARAATQKPTQDGDNEPEEDR